MEDNFNTVYANRLMLETSPYLLQNAGSPVNWYPWGIEAIIRAEELDRPIFLSIGYSSNHECLKMREESFSDSRVSQLLNREFIAIKVDREERPDIEEVYLKALKVMSDISGWPLNLILTPDLRPFYGFTYLPVEPEAGTMGLIDTLKHVVRSYRINRTLILDGAWSVCDKISEDAESSSNTGVHSRVTLEDLNIGRSIAIGRIEKADADGSCGSGLMPGSSTLRLLLSESVRTGNPEPANTAEKCLDAISESSWHDHLAGGFFGPGDNLSESPYYEKILYHNALLAQTYFAGNRIRPSRSRLMVAKSAVEFIMRDMQLDDGGFCSAISGGVDYHSWTAAQIYAILGHDAASRFLSFYRLDDSGRLFKSQEAFKGLDDGYINSEHIENDLSASRYRLLACRNSCSRLIADRKIITAWNGLAISALATAAAQLDDERYLVAARDAADAVLDRNKIRGVLSHYSINRKASNTAFLDGYACFINALLDLYTATLRSGYLFEAIRLSGEMIERFGNSHGLSYNSGSEFENAFLPARPQRLLDTFIPSAKALALQVLRRLEQVHPSPTAAKKAEELEHYLAEQIHRSREGMDYTLHVASEYSRSRTAIVLVGSAENARTQELAREARRALLPGGTLLWAAPGKAGKRARSLSPLLKKHNRDDGKPTAFFCRDGVSYADVTRVEELVKLLREVDMPKNDAPK